MENQSLNNLEANNNEKVEDVNATSLKEESNPNLSKSYIDDKFNEFKSQVNSMFVDEFSKLIKQINHFIPPSTPPSSESNNTVELNKKENNFDF